MASTDEVLAAELADHVLSLNAALGLAWASGLRVEVEMEEFRELGRRELRPLITVRVYRPL